MTEAQTSLPDSAGDRTGGARPRGRRSVAMLALLRLPSAPHGAPVAVHNISNGGLMAEYAGPVAVGDAVSIDLPDRDGVAGRVAWIVAGRIGIAFDDTNAAPVTA